MFQWKASRSTYLVEPIVESGELLVAPDDRARHGISGELGLGLLLGKRESSKASNLVVGLAAEVTRPLTVIVLHTVARATFALRRFLSRHGEEVVEVILGVEVGLLGVLQPEDLLVSEVVVEGLNDVGVPVEERAGARGCAVQESGLLLVLGGEHHVGEVEGSGRLGRLLVLLRTGEEGVGRVPIVLDDRLVLEVLQIVVVVVEVDVVLPLLGLGLGEELLGDGRVGVIVDGLEEVLRGGVVGGEGVALRAVDEVEGDGVVALLVDELLFLRRKEEINCRNSAF